MTAPDGGPRTLRRPPFPLWFHLLAAGWIAGMLTLGSARPGVYEGLLQEDRLVEWWTVTLFAAAGFLALRLAWRERRLFDALVGAFCVFVAGEEFSWGQRLLGLTPPDAFLEHNRQQELTLHNFADLFGQPKWILMMALAGFGLVLPAAAATGPGRRLLARIGATAVRIPAGAWVLAAVALLWWYPLTLTGEWVEALAGGLFLAAFAPRPRTAGAAAVGGAALAVLLTFVSGARSASESDLACARAEAEAVLQDLAFGSAATGRLAGSRSVHKRVFTAIEDGYVRAEGLEEYRAVSCGGAARDEAPAAADSRRDYAIDPWGTAYWLSMERQDSTIRIAVYSFGPNRRRDGGAAAAFGPEAGGDVAGDDVAAGLVITP